MGVEIVFKSNIPGVMNKINSTIRERMEDAVSEVRNTTVEILSGSGSGRQYHVPGTKATYNASSPGKPPASATGHLRQNIATEVSSDGKEGAVGTDDDYGRMLEFGTKGGAVILPKKGKVLAWFADGEMHFAKRIIQGPIAPRPWLRVSFEKSAQAVKEIFTKLWF